MREKLNTVNPMTKMYFEGEQGMKEAEAPN